MNIFVLDLDPVLAAQMQCDKHVVKMVLETAQMLSTVSGGPYKPTHQNHPCTLWAGRSKSNFDWLVEHGLALAEEYTFRYARRHKSQDVIESYASLPNAVPTPFAQAMPEEFRNPDVVLAYRAYYHSKASFARWTRREIPGWWKG